MERVARHSFDEHRGEVRLRIDAPTLNDVFEEAARALCELMAGDLAAGADGEEIRVSLRAPDRDALLCEWLNELVYLSETRKQVFPEARVERVDDREIAATLHVATPRVLKTPVKAATMHDLYVRRAGDAWEASIVLDV
jgi:SHS2 domain-containing protein